MRADSLPLQRATSTKLLQTLLGPDMESGKTSLCGVVNTLRHQFQPRV